MALILKGRAKLRGSTTVGKRPYTVGGVFNPELVLDFQKNYYRTNSVSKTFSNAITHTRASTATYVDSTGTLQTAAINEPRLGHHVWNGTAWVNEGLLHESEARTNLLTYSDFDAAVPTNWPVTAGASGTFSHTLGTQIQGTSTITNVQSTDGRSFLVQSLTLSTSTTYTFSCKFDPTASNISAGNTAIVLIDGLDGITAPVGRINDIDPVTGLLTFTFTTAADGTGNLRLGIGVSANSTGTLVFSQPQLEAAPTPSSYIPTSGSTVTRSADVLTIPAANLPYNSTALSIQMDGRVTFADRDISNEAVFYNWVADGNNRIVAQLNSGAGTGSAFFIQVDGGVFDFVISPSVYAPEVLVPFNISSRHGSNFLNGAVDGAALTANLTPVALPDLSATNLTLGSTYNGTIRTFRIWAQDIGDAGLVEATEPSLVPSLSLTFDGTENSFIVEDWSE